MNRHKLLSIVQEPCAQRTASFAQTQLDISFIQLFARDVVLTYPALSTDEPNSWQNHEETRGTTSSTGIFTPWPIANCFLDFKNIEHKKWKRCTSKAWHLLHSTVCKRCCAQPACIVNTWTQLVEKPWRDERHDNRYGNSHQMNKHESICGTNHKAAEFCHSHVTDVSTTMPSRHQSRNNESHEYRHSR